ERVAHPHHDLVAVDRQPTPLGDEPADNGDPLVPRVVSDRELLHAMTLQRRSLQRRWFRRPLNTVVIRWPTASSRATTIGSHRPIIAAARGIRTRATPARRAV